MSLIRTYDELRLIQGFEERYAYLRVHAAIGVDTFGFERWLNQAFYRSAQWKRVRHQVIARDRGCDLGVKGYEMHDRVIVHHMNPMRVEDITGSDSSILDPDFLVSTSLRTHNAIHYGDESLLVKPLIQRRPGDTKLW